MINYIFEEYFHYVLLIMNENENIDQKILILNNHYLVNNLYINEVDYNLMKNIIHLSSDQFHINLTKEISFI